jgi:hypothetical protein
MIKPRTPIPDLDNAVEAHARAFLADDRAAAERFVAERGIASHRAAFTSASAKRPFQSFEVLARARIGFQYVAKVRWTGAGGTFTSQNRWSNEDNRGWKIVEVEDLSVKRSPWSDIPPLSVAQSGGRNA